MKPIDSENTELIHPAIKFLQWEQQERRQLSQRLHDDLQQMMVVAKMFLQKYRISHAEADMKETMAMLDEALNHARFLAVELSPPLRFKSGVKPALEWLTKWVFDRKQLKLDLRFNSPDSPMAEEAGHFILWSVKEVLFRLHAEGSHNIKIEIEFQNLGELRISIKGAEGSFSSNVVKEFSPELTRIRERLEMLGGSIQVDCPHELGPQMVLNFPAFLFQTPKTSETDSLYGKSLQK